MDVIEAATRLDLAKVKIELLQDKCVPDVFKNRIDELLVEYQRFLALKVIFFDTQTLANISPSKILHQVWQIHCQLSQHYAECCQELGVRTIEIDSAVVNNSLEVQQKRLKTTKSRYEIIFREVPPKIFWEDFEDTFFNQNVNKMDTVSLIKVKTVADINADLVDVKPDSKLYIGYEIGKGDSFTDNKYESVATNSKIEFKDELISDLTQVKEEYIEMEQHNEICSDIKAKLEDTNTYPPLNNFSDAGLNPILKKNLNNCGYLDPTPTQKRILPIIMAGRGLEACSPSGSGKTAGYLLPIIHKLLEFGADSYKGAVISSPQCVVVVSTQGMAFKVKNEVNKLSVGTEIKSCVLYGGESKELQLEHLSKGCNILITTPKKLLESVDKAWVSSWVSFEAVQFLVLDETQHILPLVDGYTGMPGKEERQTLIFFTRFAHAWTLQSRGMRQLNNPVSVMLEPTTDTAVEQMFYSANGHEEKLQKLLEVLRENKNGEKILIFAGGKKTVEKIIFFLTSEGYSLEWIHKDRSEKKKEDALHDFYRSEVHILVSTYNTSYGPDIKDVAHVINFDLPRTEPIEYRLGKLLDGVGSTKKVSTLFNTCTDYPLHSLLVDMIRERNIDLPDWLASVTSRDYITANRSSAGLQVRAINSESVEAGTPFPAPKKKAGSFRCELCEITTCSNDNLKMHFLGAKHSLRKKLQAGMAKKMIEGDVINSDILNKESSITLKFDYNNNEFISNQEVMPIVAVTSNSPEMEVVDEASNHWGTIKQANDFWQCLSRKWEGDSTGQDVSDFPFKCAKIE